MNMMNLKDFYAKALLLEDNELIIIKYEINSYNIGKLQLSNSIKHLKAKQLKDLHKLLIVIEEYATEYYYSPKHDTP